ncbi:hypothetical protein C0J52_06702 [Blattella germanica]|nr:hypothetical protein C0J52_06702 [Blattella germanica]
MGSLSQNLAVLCRNQPNVMALARVVVRRYAAQGGKASSTTTTSSAKQISDVPGLSTAVYKLPSGEVGPGASKAGNYKNPEYFCYNKTSYFEAEIEMAKFRLPQPSSTKKN